MNWHSAKFKSLIKVRLIRDFVFLKFVLPDKSKISKLTNFDNEIYCFEEIDFDIKRRVLRLINFSIPVISSRPLSSTIVNFSKLFGDPFKFFKLP